jgi:hypothetical protein
MPALNERRRLAFALLAFGLGACQLARIPSPDGGSTCTGLPGRIPTEHRATATACAPSTRAPPIPDGGLSACGTDADCTADGGFLFGHCLRGTCAFDTCLSDSDCTTGVCGCSTDFYGGNAAFVGNVCVPADCHTDSDCGSAGFCSPSRGRCGTYQGFFCHCGTDPCVNSTTDCASPSQSCVYSPEAEEFTCSAVICNG